MTDNSHSPSGPFTQPPGSQPLTMSSLEIAERTGKEHKNVLADIRKMLTDLGIDWAEFSAEYRDSTGRTLPCFRLPQRECLILVSGYSVELRARIVDRWMELEAERAPTLPKTFSEALRLAADQAAEIDRQAGRLAEQAPKVEALARIAEADGSLCLRDAAKNLQIRPIDLKQYLIANRWIYKRAGSSEWVAYQSRIMIGLLTHKVTTVPHDDGHDRIRTQVRITPKGIARLGEELAIA